MESVQGKHAVSLRDRQEMRIDGVTEVLSFDESSVMLKTQCGDMVIEGNSLRIAVLEIDAGIVVLNGTVSGVYYYEQESNDKHSFIKRLFK
jgi:sporulation protein YabP